MVTIEEFLELDKKLEIGCFRCRLHLYVDPTLIPVPGTTPIPEVADLLKCPQCYCVNEEPGYPIWTRPDARPPPMGAFASQAPDAE